MADYGTKWHKHNRPIGINMGDPPEQTWNAKHSTVKQQLRKTEEGHEEGQHSTPRA